MSPARLPGGMLDSRASREASPGLEAAMNDADLVHHLHAVHALVARAPQRAQIVCGTAPVAADGRWPTAQVVTLRATEARGCTALYATLDEQEHRVAMATGEDHFVTRRRWEFVIEGAATEVSHTFASWLLARGVAFGPRALNTCTPVGIGYVLSEDGSVRMVSRAMDADAEPPQVADECGWPPFRRAPRRASATREKARIVNP